MPTIRSINELPEDVAELAKAKIYDGKKRWSLPLGIAASVCFLIMFYCWFYAGGWAIERLQKPTPMTVQDEIDFGDKVVEKLAPADLWDVWNEYRSSGLGNKDTPAYFRWKRFLEARDKQIWIYTAIGAAAAIGLITSIAIDRRRKR